MKFYWRAEVAVFLSGAAAMVIELAGSRIIAPYVGTSIIVWSSLIGSVLASLSLGYWWGGLYADRSATYASLSRVLFLAAVATGGIALVQGGLFSLLPHLPGAPLRAVFSCIILFAPANIFFGMVPPCALRLTMHDMTSAGSVAGRLSALGALGSIMGTFLTGFVLITYFGTVPIFFLLALTLLASSFYVDAQDLKAWKALALFIFLLAFAFFNVVRDSSAHAGVIDMDTPYNRVIVYESTDPITHRRLRSYATDPYGTQSAMFLDDHNEIVFDYLKYFHLAEHFRPAPSRALLLGGGAMSFPRDYILRNPDSHMDVVEIDPRVVEIARDYFDFHDDPRLAVFNEDGRLFLNRAAGTYDAIYVDAFRNSSFVPFHLATREVVLHMYNLLSDDGVVVVNLISAIEGDKSAFFRAQYATYRSVFPQVYAFPVDGSEDADQVQNIILIALRKKEPASFATNNLITLAQLGHLWKGNVPVDTPIFTDDFAPADQYLARTQL